jgi:DNA-binding response OmpR family regulator
MSLRALLLCREKATIHLLTRGFKEFSVDIESYPDPKTAVQRLTDQRFEAILVDAKDREEAMLLLDSLKPMPSCKNSLRIVLADRETALGAAFSIGIHLVIYKPISTDRLRSSIGAMCNLLGRRYQRESERIRVKLPAIVNVGDSQIPASIFSISSGGVALSTKQTIYKAQNLGLQFALPGGTGKISTSAEVVWNDVLRGRIGAQFVNIEPAARKFVCDWIATQSSAKRLRATVSSFEADA